MEMETRQMNAGGVKKGQYLMIEDVACRVTDIKISKPGKHGEAKARIEGVGLMDEKKRVIIKPTGHNVFCPIILKKTCQILSIQGETAQVMDMEDYSTFDMQIPEEMKGKVVEGAEVGYWVIGNQKVLKDLKSP